VQLHVLLDEDRPTATSLLVFHPGDQALFESPEPGKSFAQGLIRALQDGSASSLPPKAAVSNGRCGHSCAPFR
jgi:hypothetical protein